MYDYIVSRIREAWWPKETVLDKNGAGGGGEEYSEV